MHINLSKQALTDELGEPALTQQIMCTADISSTGGDGAALGLGGLASHNQSERHQPDAPFFVVFLWHL